MNVASLEYLQISLSRNDPLIRLAVERAQSAGHDPTDALRGLIVSDAEVEVHLAQPALGGLWTVGSESQPGYTEPQQDDGDLPFLFIIHTFGLSSLDAN